LHLTDKAEVLHRDVERFIRTASGTGRDYTLQLANRLFGAKRFDFVRILHRLDPRSVPRSLSS
jgi:hypothetical protein